MRVAPTDLLGSGALGTPLVAVCETLWFRPDSYFDPEWRGTWSGEGGGPTLGHGIHQIDLLLHLLGPWRDRRRPCGPDRSPGRVRGRVAGHRQVREMAPSGTVMNSLLSPRELSRIRIDTTAGTLEVNHVYGYRDADWSWSPAPSATTAASLGRDPGLPSAEGGERRKPADGDDVWTATAGLDLPSNHTAQIDQLVDDLLAGRTHQTTLASTRGTVEFVTAVYASSVELEHRPPGGSGAGPPASTPTSPAGLAADTITAR